MLNEFKMKKFVYFFIALNIVFQIECAGNNKRKNVLFIMADDIGIKLKT